MQTCPIYRIRNWSDYNKALIQRGSINFWIDENALKKWHSSFHTCKAGRPQTYSDEAILMILLFREVYNRTLRILFLIQQALKYTVKASGKLKYMEKASVEPGENFTLE